MNKQELIRIIAADAELSQRDATVLLDCALETIMSAVAAGEKVQRVGFGSFEARERSSRNGYNINTGKTFEIPSSVMPVFRPGVLFKEKVAR